MPRKSVRTPGSHPYANFSTENLDEAVNKVKDGTYYLVMFFFFIIPFKYNIKVQN